MNFQPAPVVGAYGYAPNVTAWGGIPVLLNGTYHHLVVEIVNKCGLCTWGTNSRVIHATSNNLLGPYTFQNESLPVWAHNPHVCPFLSLPFTHISTNQLLILFKQLVIDRSSGSPVYLLFHIGTADGGVTPKVCDGGFTETEPLSDPQASGILHTATSPAGPWTPQNPPGKFFLLSFAFFFILLPLYLLLLHLFLLIL